MNSQPNLRLKLFLAACLGLALAGCGPGSAPAATPTSAPTATATIAPEIVAERLEILDIVWNTVNERYFDPEFNGVDWPAVYDEYRPQILAAADGQSFYVLLNQMCFELGVSHIAVLPPDSTDIEPLLSAPAAAGLDLRLIDGQAVITEVADGSPAATAGLRPGYVILSVNDLDVADGEELVDLWVPPFNDRHAEGQILAAVLNQLYGPADQAITITYLDESDQRRQVSLELAERDLEPFDAEGLPPMYVGMESRELAGGIAYIRLDAFLPPILEGTLAAIGDMGDAPAMIIDVRGNPGGIYPVRKAIASQFFADDTLLWHFVTRPGLDLPDFEHYAWSDPPAAPYLGPVVVLVDLLSGSSAEEFAGAMQANGRATIIGQPTSGSDLVGDIIILPNGGTFMYPIAQTRTSDGTVLEDHGVIPDLTVLHDRLSLLNGVDAQLEAAVRFLSGN